MNISKELRQKANAIAARYSKRLHPAKIQHFYNELNEIGIMIPCFTADKDSHPYILNYEEVENSLFVYQVYKPENTDEWEFNMYFS